MRNLKPSLSLSQERQVDVIEFNFRANEKIFGDRCRTPRARSENCSGEQFGVASRAITPWIRDGPLIAAGPITPITPITCYGLCPARAITP